MIDLQRQAWDTATPESVITDLKNNYQVSINGDVITVKPAVTERLKYLIPKYKNIILEKFNNDYKNGIAGRVEQVKQKIGFTATQESCEYQKEERLAIVLADKPVMKEKVDAEEFPLVVMENMEWQIPKQKEKQKACSHQNMQLYRLPGPLGSVVKQLCPECGHNGRGAGRQSKYSGKRSSLPWWPKVSAVKPDPDEEIEQLIDWWNVWQDGLTDDYQLPTGQNLGNADSYKRFMWERIALWKLGEPNTWIEDCLRTLYRMSTSNTEAA